RCGRRCAMFRRVENGTAEPSRRGHWRGLMAEWSASGQTQAAFCRARGLNPGTFAWWRRRLRTDERASAGARARRGRRPGEPGEFVEVRLAGVRAVEPTGPSAGAYEVVLSCGRSIRVPWPFDPQALSRLIAAVESVPGTFGGAGLPC
ncbi:MAG: IS66 family insertion sequence element accessory protein TnpA, partial [Phycisphaerae bacterium]